MQMSKVVAQPAAHHSALTLPSKFLITEETKQLCQLFHVLSSFES